MNPNTHPGQCPGRATLHREIAALVEREAQGSSFASSKNTDPLAQLLAATGDYFGNLYYLSPERVHKLHRIFGEYLAAHPRESAEVSALLSALTVNAYAQAENTELSRILVSMSGDLPALAKRHGLVV